MKIIIFGATEIAYLIAFELHKKNDVIVIDKEENCSSDFKKLDISFINGDTASIEILNQAGIKEASYFIACSLSEESNIVACFSAKRSGKVKTICFVQKKDYKTAFGSTNDVECNYNLYIDHIIWPEELLTKEIFRIVTVAKALDVEYFANGKARLLEYKIEKNSVLVDKVVKNCDFPENTLIIGITREEGLFIPYGDTVLKEDDKVIFMGLSNSLDLLAAKFFHPTGYKKNIVIIGGGNVGLMLAKYLEDLKLTVKIIEKNIKRCDEISQILKNVLVVNGDGTDLELLAQEEADIADVVISVTDNDEKNLLCSLLTKQMGVNRVISRVSKQVNIPLFEKVGIDIAVSSKKAALHEVKKFLSQTNIDILATVDQGKGEVLEIIVDENFSQCKLMDLKLPARAVIGMIHRNNKVIIPKGDTLIFSGDEILLFTIKEFAPVIKDFFKAK